MTDDDVADWELLRRGDRAAFARIFDRHEARVFRHASRLLRVREDAKDTMTIAFFELWRRRGSSRLVNGSLLPWLLNTAANTARNFERSSRRYQLMLGRLPDPEPSAPVRAADESGILAALRRLPEREQSVIVLTVLEGYQERETARALGIPVGTVKSRLARAKERLRGELEQIGYSQ